MQPAVTGDAMDVPLSMWYDPSGTGYVLTCTTAGMCHQPSFCGTLRRMAIKLSLALHEAQPVVSATGACCRRSQALQAYDSEASQAYGSHHGQLPMQTQVTRPPEGAKA